MKSLEQIYNEFQSYADKLELKGLYADTLSRLLSYVVYTKNSEIFPIITELDPRYSKKLNSKIFFAHMLGQSVFRGNVPKIIYHQIPIIKRSYKKFDLATSSNGYYFYWANDLDISDEDIINRRLKDITFYVTTKECIETTIPLTGDGGVESTNRIEVNTQNLSEDILLLNDKSEEMTWTNSINEFQELNPDTLSYKYKFLIQTLREYSFMIIKRDSDSWDFNTLTIKSLPYNETYPEFWKNIVIPGFARDPGVNPDESTDIIDSIKRNSSKDGIIDESFRLWSLRNSIASTQDLITVMKSQVRSEFRSYFNVSYKDKYVLLDYYTDDIQFDNSEVFRIWNSWSKTVEVNETLLVHRIPTPGVIIPCNVTVNQDSTVTQSDLDSITESFFDYIGKELQESTVIYQIMSKGAAYCTLDSFGVNNVLVLHEDNIPYVDSSGTSRISSTAGIYPNIVLKLEV